MLRKVGILALMCFFVSGCGSSNISKKLLGNVNGDLQKNHKIRQGYLVATYDLAKVSKPNCIYAKDYVRIINEDSYNKIFLKKFRSRYKNIKLLDQEAANKVNKLRDLTLKLNNKYKFLPNSEVAMLKGSIHNGGMRELSKIDKIVASIPMMLPQLQPNVSSYYGNRDHPVHGSDKFHCGIDLVDKKSAPVYSAAAGKVVIIGRKSGYGNLIEVKHPGKFKTKYAHLKKIFVKEGEQVIRGQKIGLQGKTGNATGEHLHFEIWLNSKHVNPYDFLVHACRCG